MNEEIPHALLNIGVWFIRNCYELYTRELLHPSVYEHEIGHQCI